MKQTTKTKIQLLLKKIHWLEEHACEMGLVIMLCGPIICYMIACVANPHLYEHGAFRDVPATIVVAIIGVLVFIFGNFIVPKILLRKTIALYKSLPHQEQLQISWIDGWKYWNI